MLRIAFYKAEGKLLDKVIRWWTKSPYSHCELLFPDNWMFSADAWSNRVRFTDQFNLENWDVFSVPLDDGKLLMLRDWCAYREGRKYDWWGVVQFLLPFVKQSPDRWFCSELCAAGLKFVGKIPVRTETSKISPQGLFELLSTTGKA